MWTLKETLQSKSQSKWEAMRSPELGSQNVSFEPPGNHSLFSSCPQKHSMANLPVFWNSGEIIWKFPKLQELVQSTTKYKLLLRVCSPNSPCFRVVRKQTKLVILKKPLSNGQIGFQHRTWLGTFGAVWARAHGIARMNILGTVLFNCL